MAYTKKIWKDYPDTTTPIKAEDLNNIEDGLETVDTALETVDTALENIENNVNNIGNGIEAVDTALNSGWISLTGTFTYVSWDSSVYTGVVNSNLDLTPYLSVGMKVKFTQNSAIKYAFITAITSTQLTLFLGTDYSLNNSAISNSYYSMLKAPFGFPLEMEKWSVIVTDTTARSQASPDNGILYNLGNTAITVPIGYFKLSYSILVAGSRSSAGNIPVAVLLSTATNSISDSELLRKIEATAVTQFGYISIYCEKNITLTSKTVYYMIIYAGKSGLAGIYEANNQQTLKIMATCLYL